MIAAAACLLLGDSIALRAKPYLPDCQAVVKNGITSNDVVARAPADLPYGRVIVSMGTNDKHREPLLDNLATIRARYPNARFVWLAPRRGKAAIQTYEFATEHNDQVVQLREFASTDHIHPADMRDVVAHIAP